MPYCSCLATLECRSIGKNPSCLVQSAVKRCLQSAKGARNDTHCLKKSCLQPETETRSDSHLPCFIHLPQNSWNLTPAGASSPPEPKTPGHPSFPPARSPRGLQGCLQPQWTAGTYLCWSPCKVSPSCFPCQLLSWGAENVLPRHFVLCLSNFFPLGFNNWVFALWLSKAPDVYLVAWLPQSRSFLGWGKPAAPGELLRAWLCVTSSHLGNGWLEQGSDQPWGTLQPGVNLNNQIQVPAQIPEAAGENGPDFPVLPIKLPATAV